MLATTISAFSFVLNLSVSFMNLTGILNLSAKSWSEISVFGFSLFLVSGFKKSSSLDSSMLSTSTFGSFICLVGFFFYLFYIYKNLNPTIL